MKIDFKTLYESNFNINISSSKKINSTFEEYLKIVLAQIKEEKNFSKDINSKKLEEILQKVRTSLEVLESLAPEGLDTSSAETLGDFLLAQALEINQILNLLPEDSLKHLLKDITFFIGIEAQKIRQGFYS